MEQTTFTITQIELGAALLWEPALGTAEHDRLVDAYITGPGSLQQKRATIALDFFDTVAASSLPPPFCRTYHVSVPIYSGYATVRSSPNSSTSLASSWSVARPSSKSSPSSTSSKPAKRAREEASPPSSASKRLPGFSIMTKDGIDITDNQSRGPKTKEQREHAAKMRKLGACPACKRSKQKCEPSHHRPLASAESAPMSATPSSASTSTLPSYQTSSTGSRASISPATSFDSSFSPPSMVAHTGKRFSPLVPSKPALSPSDLMDMPQVTSNQADLGSFGLDLNFDDASLGADFSFAQPPFDQDFDLFSYDQTLDFDSFLNYSPPFNLDGEYSQSSHDYSNISPGGYDFGLVQPSSVFSSSRPAVRSQPQPQVYIDIDSDERASPSSYDSDQSRSSQSSYSDQHDVWDGAALHGGSSYLSNTAPDENYSLHDHGVHGHASSSSSSQKRSSTPPRDSLEVFSEEAFAGTGWLLLEAPRARSELARIDSQSGSTQGIFEESSPDRSEWSRLSSKPSSTQGIFEESSPGRSESARRRSPSTAGQGIFEESSPGRSESAHVRSQSGATEGIFTESSPGRSESSRRRSQPTAAQGIFEVSSQLSGTIARRTPQQDSIRIPSGIPMEDSADNKTTDKKSRRKSRSHAVVERRENGIIHGVQDELTSDVRSQRLKDDRIQSRSQPMIPDKIQSHSQPTSAILSGAPTTLVSQLAVAGKALVDGFDGFIRLFSGLRVTAIA